MQTPDGFISIASQLGGKSSDADAADAEQEVVFEETAPEAYAMEEAALLRDVRLFRAGVAEALEDSVRALLCDIAAAVLARELQLAPADIAAIVRGILERFAQDQPLRIRANPADAASVDCDVPVLEDPRLPQGDVVVELRSGSAVSSLGLRLDAVLANLPP